MATTAVAPAHQSVALMQEVLKTVACIGYDKTLVILKNSRERTPAELSDPVVDFVASMVCDQFSLPLSDLFNPAARTDAKKYGQAFFVYYLKEHFSFSYKKLRALLGGVNRTTVLRKKLVVDKLSPKSKVDQGYLARMHAMNVRVNEYKLTNSLK